MIRALALILLATVTMPLFAQWQTRAGVRAGFVFYQASGFRNQTDSATSTVYGGDLWVGRNRVALTAGIDGYQIQYVGTVFLLGGNAQFLLGDVNGAHVGIGAGPSFAITDNGNSFVIVPVASVNIPWGRRQVYVSARYHQANASSEAEDPQTTLLMFGVRTGPFGR